MRRHRVTALAPMLIKPKPMGVQPWQTNLLVFLSCLGASCGDASNGAPPGGGAAPGNGSGDDGLRDSSVNSLDVRAGSADASGESETPKRDSMPVTQDDAASPSHDAATESFDQMTSTDAALAEVATDDGWPTDGAAAEDSSMTARDSGAGSLAPGSFHCVNWADSRDNFVNGLLQISGLSSATDTYATVQAKAGNILSGFQTVLGANAIRVPINEPTVLGSWWAAYKGVIDTAAAKGMKVIIAYWAYHNGKPDDVSAYDNMWRVVVAAYGGNPLVFFDIHNEPYGYSGGQWTAFAAQWLLTFPTVPKDHVIVAGTGYDQDVTQEGADARLDGTVLSLHAYPFFSTGTTTAQAWRNYVSSHVGTYAARTIVTEWGAPMTTGVNYTNPPDGANEPSFMHGAPDQMRASGMGSCFWPGLRIGDSWSITTLQGTGANPPLSVTNASGLGRIHWAWGL